MILKPLGNTIPARALSSVFGATVFLRNRYYDTFSTAGKSSPKPVISIGCIHAGGTGKTPLALLTAQTLAEEGYAVAFLSRGYGRKSKKNILVSPGETPDWERVGDEPALLHAAMPETWLGIGANRHANAEQLAPRLPLKAVFILDDGFAHRKIKRNLDIVCLPPDPFDDYLIPAGYQREPLANLKRADVACFISSPDADDLVRKSREKLLAQFPQLKIFMLQQTVTEWVDLHTGRCADRPALTEPVMVSGIARPERFTALLTNLNIKPVSTHFFSDHHVFTHADINYIKNITAHGIITTEKDAVRLQRICRALAVPAWFVRIRPAFLNQESKTLFKSIVINRII